MPATPAFGTICRQNPTNSCDFVILLYILTFIVLYLFICNVMHDLPIFERVDCLGSE